MARGSGSAKKKKHQATGTKRRDPKKTATAAGIVSTAAAAPPEPTTGATLKRELVALARIGSRYPANTPAEAAAFASLATDARRSDLGKLTKAAAVLREAVAVAVAIDAAFRDHRATLAPRYSARRFRFLLDAIDALGASLGAPAAGAGRSAAAAAAAALKASAEADKKRLVRAMQSFAGQRDAELASLDDARRAGASDADPLSTSIGALVDLAWTWLERKDPTSAILLVSAGLDGELVDKAMASARAYAKGAAEVTLAGRRAGNDSPLVNLREGGVVVEIVEADHAFTALAEETNGIVARLPLGKALRRVARSRPKTAAKPPNTSTPTPGT